MSDLTKEALEYLIGQGAAAQLPVQVEDHYPFITIPREMNAISLKQFLKNKERIEQKIQILDIGSFIEYFNKYKSPTSKIFMNDLSDKKYLHAVFDYHKEDGTGQFLAHSARYDFPHSDEWMIWALNDGKPMSQEEFAVFIEDNYLDIISPAHATMLEIASTIEVTNHATFERGIRLQSGQVQFNYTQDIRGTASKGQMQIPEMFKLRLRVFNRGDQYDIDARLRYRVNNGELTMWYDLVTPHKVIEKAVLEIENLVNEKTEQNMFRGVVG